MSTNDRNTRAVFDLTGPLDYKLFEIANPDRIVLDIRASSFAEGFATPAGKGPAQVGAHRQAGQGRCARRFRSRRRCAAEEFPAAATGEEAVPTRRRACIRETKSKSEIVKSVRRRSRKPRDVVIAIDAGHGGDDPGATGAAGTHEKEITLAVARELKRLIDKQPGMSAVLTRDGDYFIPLKQRYQKAREAKADLFVSVHADAYTSGDARGSSVWMLSPRGATSEAARWLADRENRADLVGGVSLDRQGQHAGRGAARPVAGRDARSQRRRRQPGAARAGEDRPDSSRLMWRKRTSSCCARRTCRRSWSRPRSSRNPAEEKRLNNPEQREKLAKRDPRWRAQLFRRSAAAGQLVRVERAQGTSRSTSPRAKASAESR